MRMTFESPERIRIELNALDMSDLDVTVEELDYRSDKTRRILRDLLRRIGAETLLSGESGKRLIEVFPSNDGGCIIYFTSIHKASALRSARIQATATVWAVENDDDLLAAMDALKRQRGGAPVALYQMPHGYRFVVPFLNARQELLLSEFARQIPHPTAVSLTAEHGVLLAANAAISAKREAR